MEWITTPGFNLALEKPEVVILIKERIPSLRPILFGESIRESKPAIKFLPLTLDSKMSFSEQIKVAAIKAAAGVSALSRLMTNSGGPSSSRRRFLSSTQFVPLFGAEVWASAPGKEAFRMCLAQVQGRGVLRVASAYRTLSQPAVMVIAGVIPVAFLLSSVKPYTNAREMSQGRLLLVKNDNAL